MTNEQPTQATEDGGTATATVDSEPGPDSDDGEEWQIEPWAVLRVARDDPLIPIEHNEDAEPPTLRSLRPSEAAHATWKVMKRARHDHRLLGIPNGPVYGYEEGVWSDSTGEDLLRRVGVDSLGPPSQSELPRTWRSVSAGTGHTTQTSSARVTGRSLPRADSSILRTGQSTPSNRGPCASQNPQPGRPRCRRPGVRSIHRGERRTRRSEEAAGVRRVYPMAPPTAVRKSALPRRSHRLWKGYLSPHPEGRDRCRGSRQ